MTHDLEYVRLLAEATLIGWEVDLVHFHDLRTWERTVDRSDSLTFSARRPAGKYREFFCTFAPSESLAWTTMIAVEHIQDCAIELTWGEAIPPCPGHSHPLSATVIDGVPRWMCMTEGAARYARNILPGFDPSFETPEEYLLLREAHG